MSETKWQSRTCNTGFERTLWAIDHRIANEDADIHPVYNNE
jgi:hypothetical protein